MRRSQRRQHTQWAASSSSATAGAGAVLVTQRTDARTDARTGTGADTGAGPRAGTRAHATVSVVVVVQLVNPEHGSGADSPPAPAAAATLKAAHAVATPQKVRSMDEDDCDDTCCPSLPPSSEPRFTTLLLTIADDDEYDEWWWMWSAVAMACLAARVNRAREVDTLETAATATAAARVLTTAATRVGSGPHRAASASNAIRAGSGSMLL
eukprot:CAMPEP_0171803596 /NCGR_PEP_ID=MMETSP0991-20121206/73576_1 /TAXON_ID=483369 /ORGANISM="non described non described, Strain CCMP2098" /LENGTH=209 /DNA_ID=CAMNT_0012415741 /DNA_START=75 /DNA_END=702 /DNA_ORIENTATION=+